MLRGRRIETGQAQRTARQVNECDDPARTRELLQHYTVNHQRRRHPERNNVGERVELAPKRTLVSPEARNPSYRLRIDFGPDLGVRVSAAQLTRTYPDPAALVGRQVVAVVNFPPRRIAGFASEVLVLGAMGEGTDAGEVWLLEPNPDAPLGLRIG